MKLTPDLRSPPHRPITHLALAVWLTFLAWIAVRIWRRAFETGVLDVRGPALVRAEEPLLFWLGMGGAMAVVILVAAAAMLAAKAFWLNVSRGKTAK